MAATVAVAVDAQQQSLKRFEKLKKLKERNPLVTKTQKQQTNALHQTILDGRIKQFTYFLQMGSKVNARDKYGRTCLMLACLSDHEEYGLQVAKLLLKHGADLNIQDKLGRSALFMACDARRERLFIYLLDNHLSSIDLRLKDNDGNILLNHAAINGTTNMLRTLLDKMLAKRIDVDQRNIKGNTALLLAIQNEKFMNALVLIQHGQASPYFKDDEKFFNALEWLLFKFNALSHTNQPHQHPTAKQNGGDQMQSSILFEQSSLLFNNGETQALTLKKEPKECIQMFERVALGAPKSMLGKSNNNNHKLPAINAHRQNLNKQIVALTTRHGITHQIISTLTIARTRANMSSIRTTRPSTTNRHLFRSY